MCAPTWRERAVLCDVVVLCAPLGAVQSPMECVLAAGLREDVSVLVMYVGAVRCRARWLDEHPHSSSVLSPASAGTGRWRPPQTAPASVPGSGGVCKTWPRRLRSGRGEFAASGLPSGLPPARLFASFQPPPTPASGSGSPRVVGRPGSWWDFSPDPRLGHPAPRPGAPRPPPRPFRGSRAGASPAASRGAASAPHLPSRSPFWLTIVFGEGVDLAQ